MSKGQGFDLGNYVEVDERITRFYERYPDGRIATLGIPQVVEIGGKSFIVAQAAAYRTADDPQPCVGTAAEPYPGQTTYTRDSEMMNAETSAWGRAIVAAGILAKGEGVASRNEVRNRSAQKIAPIHEAADQGPGAEPLTTLPGTRANSVAPPPTPQETLERARAHAKPAPDLRPEEMVCPRCGKAEALRPAGNPRFCAKASGGCGAPAKGDAFTLVPYGAWKERHK